MSSVRDRTELVVTTPVKEPEVKKVRTKFRKPTVKTKFKNA